nr:hypothetical protein [Tanacetum cinerariifolium]
MACGKDIDEMLTINMCMAGINEEIFTLEAWTNAFNIDEPIYSELFHEFYSTYEFGEVCDDEEAFDTTKLRELIDSEGRLIPKVPEPGVPRVSIPRPPRASIHDLYEMMGRMEIRQGVIKRMFYRYDQQQYDQYYQQYPTQQQQPDDDDE